MEQTSLKRLLAISRSASSLGDSLNEAADVLKLPKDWHTFDSDAIKDVKDTQGSAERAEWVLKWLLSKLNDSSETAPNPRLTPGSWILLEWLVSIISIRVSAKLLGEARFPKLLEDTLTGVTKLSITTPAKDQDRTDDTQSKKRKRDSGAAIANSKTTEPSLAKILLAIDGALLRLRQVGSAEEIKAAKNEKEQLRAALRPDLDRASRILQIWELQVLRLCETKQDLSANLSSPIWLWSLATSRSVDADQERAVSFSKCCLISTIQLLGVDEAHIPDPEQHPVAHQAENLLLDELILPVRSAFLAAGATRDRRTKSGEAARAHLNDLLEPVRKEVLAVSAAHGRYSQQVKNILKSVADLWNLVLKTVPRPNQQRRLIEDPWLKDFFESLANCAGSSVTGSWTIAVHPFPEVILGKMLDACAIYDFSPGPSLLAAITRRYSGMCLPEEEHISWSLLGKIMLIDASIFLPTYSEGPSVDFFDDAGPLHELIIRHLSAMPWKLEYDQHTTFYQIAARDAGALPHSTRAFIDQNHLSPGDFMAAVPVKLLQAYSHARDLTGFLSRWRTELVKSTRHIVIGTGKCSLWEDHSLRLALGTALETSLTERQVVDILKSYASPFEDLEEAQNVMYVFTELRQNAQGTGAAANLVLLDALVGAIRLDASAELAKDILLQLHRSLARVGSKPAINKLPIISRIWRILATTNRLLSVSSSPTERRQLVQTATGAGCVQVAVESMREASECDANVAAFERGSQAFFFVLTHHELEPNSEALQDALEVCVDCITMIDKMPRRTLAARALESTRFFDLIPEAQRRALFGHLCARATGQKYQGESSHEARQPDPIYAPILNALIELALTTFSAEARNDLLRGLSFDLLYHNAETDPFGRGNFAEAKLSRFPSTAIPRELREKCLDIVAQLLQQRAPGKGDDSDQLQGLECHLSFMLKMMEAPNATAKLCTDTECLLKLIRDKDLVSRPELGKLYEELVRRVLEHVTSPVDFGDALASKALQYTETAGKSKSKCAAWLAIRCLITRVPSGLQADLLNHEVAAFKNRVARKAPEKIGREEAHEFIIISESLRLHVNLVQSAEELLPQIRQIQLYEGMTAALNECRAVQSTLNDDFTIQEQQQLLNDLFDKLLGCEIQQRLEVLAHLDELASRENQSGADFAVLRILIKTLPRVIKGHDEFELPVDLLARLSSDIATTNDIRTFGAVCECIKIVLTERNWLVTQHGIDSLLSNLTILTSKGAPELHGAHSGGVYVQACSLATTAVLLHRIKLQGRFHLLIPLLINLLQCLFIPHAQTDVVSSSSRPHWMQDTASPLSQKHAAAFARLITTLSSPTSALAGLKRRRSSAGSTAPLKDDIKVARAEVGEYIPALLAAYCKAQLSGSISHGARKALMPGLWVAMETVERDAWKAMSERLGEQERAVWQSVWSEWNRVGRGDKRQR